MRTRSLRPILSSAVLATLLVVGTAHAAIFHVSTTGDDGPGCGETPEL
jgi:hypothetical protein